MTSVAYAGLYPRGSRLRRSLALRRHSH